jgi:hypothetical protein
MMILKSTAMAMYQPALLLSVLMICACTPTVQLQAPDKPIEINLNVKIEQHVKVEIERDVKKAIATNKDIF